MRLSRSALKRLFAGPAGFAHRGLHGPGVPENSMAAFRAAIVPGAGIECDLRLSCDGFAMIFHDSDLQRLCGVGVETESLPAAALRELRLSGTDERIPWLGELLEIAGDTPVLLELKVRCGRQAGPVDLLCRTVARQLEEHDGPVGVMSFDPRIAAWFALHMRDIPRGLVIADRLSPMRRLGALGVARPDFIAVETSAAAKPWAARQRRRRPVASWTVRSTAQRLALQNQVDALIWEGDGRP